jgi:hypothetical protein
VIPPNRQSRKKIPALFEQAVIVKYMKEFFEEVQSRKTEMI